MKLKFWKKIDKSQAKRKCCRESSDFIERENLRTNVEELRNYVDIIAQQQQKLEQLFNAVNLAVYKIDQTNAIHEQLSEEAKRAEKWHKERLIRAIRQMKEEHRKELERLETVFIDNEEVENSFQSYKLSAEKAMKDKDEEMHKLQAELHEMQQKYKQLQEASVPCQVFESYNSPLTDNVCIDVKKPVALRPSLQNQRIIQAPQNNIGGLTYNPHTSAFLAYTKEHSDLISHSDALLQPVSFSHTSPEDAEVAAILP